MILLAIGLLGGPSVSWAEPVERFCAEAGAVCVGPGNLAVSGSAVEQFCRELLRGNACRYPTTACKTTSLEEDATGADLILVGKAVRYDDELTHQMRAQLQVSNGEVWKIRLKKNLKAQAPSAAFHVWHTFEPGRLFQRGRSHLLLLKTMSGEHPMYQLYSTGCNQHSRPLNRAPLTAAERQTIRSVQEDHYQAARLAGLCESAGQLASGKASVQAELDEAVQSASRLCEVPQS